MITEAPFVALARRLASCSIILSGTSVHPQVVAPGRLRLLYAPETSSVSYMTPRVVTVKFRSSA